MTSRLENTVPKPRGIWDEEHIENWGIYRCRDCGVLKRVPVFLYEHEPDRKGHCEYCERQTKVERIDE